MSPGGESVSRSDAESNETWGQLLSFRGIVFDLDGTLCALEIDWSATRQELEAIGSGHAGVDLSGLSVWEMLRRTGGEQYRALDAALRERELHGARRAHPLPLAAVVPRLAGRAVGVVSLNSRDSCREALERLGLRPFVQVLVGREDAPELKPHPAPLLLCLQGLRISPVEAVFVGDRDRDRETAHRAGTAFLSAQTLSVEDNPKGSGAGSA